MNYALISNKNNKLIVKKFTAEINILRTRCIFAGQKNLDNFFLEEALTLNLLVRHFYIFVKLKKKFRKKSMVQYFFHHIALLNLSSMLIMKKLLK